MTKKSPKHARLDTVNAHDGELQINGMSLSEVAARAGSTPFYAYDRALIRDRLKDLRAALPDAVHLHFAIKANPMPAVVGYVSQFVDGLDVASQLEMHVALNAGMRPEDISFAGPGKRLAELRAAIGARVCLNVESELEIQRVAELSEELGIAARVAVRVNPDFELKGSGMKMSGSGTQFGIDSDRVQSAAKMALNAGLVLEGFHIFCGSQNLNAEHIVNANRQTFELAAKLVDQCGIDAPRINIGGGYGIPYFPGEQNLDLNAVGNGLHELIDSAPQALKEAQFIVELGRFIVGEAGYYVTRVMDIKQSRGSRFAIVDGGLHHHLSNSGNFGQVLRKNYPVALGSKLGSTQNMQEVSVVGPLCTPLDKVADKMVLPNIELDDLVVVFQSGAYGYTASPQAFLSHPPPVELLI